MQGIAGRLSQVPSRKQHAPLTGGQVMPPQTGRLEDGVAIGRDDFLDDDGSGHGELLPDKVA